MTQKNLSFKFQTLVGNCCRRQSALFTLSALAMIAALPVYMILAIQSQLRYSDLTNPEVRNSVVLNIRDMLMTGTPVTLSLIALAVIAGIAMFRYLHVRNQTDFFHSLPITRGQMFASHTLSGILAVVPAYLIGTALTCAVCAAYGFSDAIDTKLLAYSVFAHLAGFLMVYAVTILAAIVSGHTLVSLLVCGWFQFGVFAGWAIINQLLYVLYPARVYNIQVNPYWLSPPLQMVKMVGTLGTGYYNNSAVTLALHPFRDACLIPALAYAAAAAVVLALCWLLNNIRKSEHTGLSIAFPGIEQPFKLYMVTVMGVGCGLVFQATTTNWGVMFLGMALGALVTSCVVEIVYNLDFHSLFYRWRSLLVYGGVCAVVLGCMAMDVTHWNSALPDRDQIVSAELRSNAESWDCSAYGERNNYYVEGSGVSWWPLARMVSDAIGWDTSNDETFGEAVEPMTSAVAIDAMYDSASIGAEAMKGDRSNITTGQNYENQGYQVTFTLKNGKTFTRQYYMPANTEQLNENGTTVRFSQEYLENRTSAARAADESFDPVVLIVKNYANANQSACDTVKQKQGVTSILKKLKTESMQLTREYVSQNAPVLVIRAINTYDGWSWNDLTNLNAGYYSDRDLRMIDIPVYACETDTLKILKQYAPELETGYASEKVDRVTVEYWTDGDEEFVSETYDDVETVEECMKHSYPYEISQTMDPVFMHKRSAADIRLTLSNGTELSCYYYGDDDRLKQAKEEETQETGTAVSVGVIGGADGPTAIMISATANQQVKLVIGCLIGLIAVIVLARWMMKRHKKK